MELFYTHEVEQDLCYLDSDESNHLIKVLRHRLGDKIDIVDGRGTLFHCELIDASYKRAVAKVLNINNNWASHNYFLTMAVSPTKNNDRYEWFAEKATELGIDEIVPIIGEHSERKVFKKNRVERVVLSAMKQSLKASLPVIQDIINVKDYIESVSNIDAIKLIAHCEDNNKRSINDYLESAIGKKIIILIGPEGDFSMSEIDYAIKNGFKPIHLGDSRLRTETAALTGVEAVYLKFI